MIDTIFLVIISVREPRLIVKLPFGKAILYTKTYFLLISPTAILRIGKLPPNLEDSEKSKVFKIITDKIDDNRIYSRNVFLTKNTTHRSS